MPDATLLLSPARDGRWALCGPWGQHPKAPGQETCGCISVPIGKFICIRILMRVLHFQRQQDCSGDTFSSRVSVDKTSPLGSVMAPVSGCTYYCIKLLWGEHQNKFFIYLHEKNSCLNNRIILKVKNCHLKINAIAKKALGDKRMIT